jgi:hypothetical protein
MSTNFSARRASNEWGRKGLEMNAKYNNLLDNPYFMTTLNCVAFALWFWVSFALLS